MNIVIINGSSRKNGATAKILKGIFNGVFKHWKNKEISFKHIE